MPAPERLRVLIIGSDRRVRRALRDLLSVEPDLEVCGTAGISGAEIGRTAGQPADAALLDLPQPDPGEGLSVLQQLRRLGIPVVVLSSTASLRQQVQMQGAAAFIEKDGDQRRILQALRGLRPSQRRLAVVTAPGACSSC